MLVLPTEESPITATFARASNCSFCDDSLFYMFIFNFLYLQILQKRYYSELLHLFANPFFKILCHFDIIFLMGQEESIGTKDKWDITFDTKEATQSIQSQISRLRFLEELILKNIVDIMVSQKSYKIRQTYRNLILQLLDISNLSVYINHLNGRVEFHNFSQNYITQVVEGSVEYSSLFSLLDTSKSHKLISATQNAFCLDLFRFDQDKDLCYCMTSKENPRYSYSLAYVVKGKVQKKLDSDLSWKIMQKIIEIAMISSDDEENTILQNYSKGMLDLLELNINYSSLIIKEKLFKDDKRTLADLFQKFCKHLEEEAELYEAIITYQEIQFEYLQRIRIYKKYTCETDKIFLDFNQEGKLRFLTNNFEHRLMAPLNKLKMQNKLSIEHIFKSNKTLQNLIKRAINGKIRNNKMYELDFETKVRIKLDSDRKINRIQVVIEDMKSQSSHSSSNIYISSTKISEEDDVEFRDKQEKNKSNLMRNLQKANPGIVQDGWINLFIKDGQSKRKLTHLKSKNIYVQQKSRSSQNLEQDSTLNLEDQISNKFLEIDIESPDLNLIEIDEQLLEPLVLKLFSRVQYFKRENINKIYFQNFLTDLKNGYQMHNNPFHNFTHGVSVMHTSYLLATVPKKSQQIFSPFRAFTLIFSGLCHDVGHTGFTNLFEIASKSKKAITYNDISPLENFHASYTFELLKKPQNNFLEALAPDQYKQFRKSVISNILFTDIKEHFPLLKKFGPILKQEIPQNEDYLTILSGMIIHTADFGGSAKQFQICKQWSLKVNLEFSNQYKMEGQLGLPLTPFMKDLTNPTILSKNQSGFLKVIVLPLYEALDSFYTDCITVRILKTHIQDNIKAWDKINAESQQQSKQKIAANGQK